ncbi:hypothetical protein QE152_g698 [Popillia japonica]|uniref:Uncharacterized protein n=1 Tax=Popillia japonica TaxID=7064 RepID=A0AAW1NKW8_POPJA
MCQKSSASSTMTVFMAKITILLIIVYFTQNAAGGFNDRPSINKKKISSCISYGHSCWGAHGKRNGATSKNTETKEDASNYDLPSDTRWFLNRLAPSSYKIAKSHENQKDLDLQNPLRESTEFADALSYKRNTQDEDPDYQELPPTQDEDPDYQELPPMFDAFYPPEDSRAKSLNDKLRFLNFLRSQKLN